MLWVITVVITVSVATYQRVTGPTWPVRGQKEVAGTVIDFKLARAHETTADAEIRVSVPHTEISGELSYLRLNSPDGWISTPMERQSGDLVAVIPKQPAAAKVAYRVTLIDALGQRYPLTTEPVVTRFKDPTPLWILLPHIGCMFTALLLSVRTGLQASFRRPRVMSLARWTLVLSLVGGLILGPVALWYAFGVWWTGWPIGSDITDNKTAVIVLMWALAVWRGSRRGASRWWFVAAALVHLLVFLIPHSIFGTAYDYTEGKAI